jgi:hypothetical protein
VLIRFVAFFLPFTFGPGAACLFYMTRGFDFPRRFVLMLAAGVPASAVLIDIMGRLGWLSAFPFVAAGLTLVVAVLWWREPSAEPPDGNVGDVWTTRDLAACALLAALAVGAGAVAFAHRLTADQNQVVVYGDYDSLDLTYYAAISAEATHTVPPTAPYYSGRELNYAYYPQLVLAMVHRFGGVPMLPIYFGYAWPAFLVIAALSGFLFVRAIASTGTALLAMVLMLIAGDFSYIAAWTLPHSNMNWDDVLWPTNFLSPTADVLHFNSWTPSLPIFFIALWAMAHGFKTREHRWNILSALLLGVLFQFKPFAFIVLSAALSAAFVFSGRDRDARWRYATVLVIGGLAALPFVYRSLRLYADRRSELRLGFFVLPERMLIKLDLVQAFSSLPRPIYLLAATVLFFAGGLGIRWMGFPRVWRAIRGGADPHAATWRVIAWVVVAGIAIPFVLVTEPYNDTLQFYQVGLYVLWIFTAAALMGLVRKDRTLGSVAIAAAIAVSLPSSVHYLSRKWHDGERPALAGLTKMEIDIADYLRTRDPETTVILNNRPLEPSPLAVLSERRVVLAWGRYAVGSGERLREVEAFFGGSRTVENTLAILRKHHVTHVVVHTGRDRVPPEVIGMLKPVMGDDEVKLYEVLMEP